MKNNFKSTQSLYGVEPEYFKDMKYFEAIEKKIVLADFRINLLNKRINYKMDEDTYKELNEQLVECKKARDFNQKLLDEMKKRERKKNENSCNF